MVPPRAPKEDHVVFTADFNATAPRAANSPTTLVAVYSHKDSIV
jgi:hypothetical protein